MTDGENSKIYAKLDDHDHRITQLESTRPFLQDLIARSVKSNEALAQTMQDVQISMTKMNDKMDLQSENLKSLQDDMATGNATMSAKINVIEEKVAKIDEEGKFNIRTYLKTNWPWILIVIGMGVLLASKYVKV